MKDLYEVLFKMFDELLKTKYKSSVDQEFISLVEEVRKKLKFTYRDMPDHEIYSTIDQEFNKYLSSLKKK